MCARRDATRSRVEGEGEVSSGAFNQDVRNYESLFDHSRGRGGLVTSEGRCDAILNFFIPPFREGRMNRRVLSRSRTGIVGSDRRLHVVKMAKLEAVGSELAGKGEMEGRVRETGPSKFFHFAEDTYTCFSLETSTSLDF